MNKTKVKCIRRLSLLSCEMLSRAERNKFNLNKIVYVKWADTVEQK